MLKITGRLADLDDVIVVIRRPAESAGALRIERSGKVVDRFYGTVLAGERLGRLTPSRDDAESEADIVFASGRTLMMENQVQLPNDPARIARLYLPFADANGRVAGIVPGITKVV